MKRLKLTISLVICLLAGNLAHSQELNWETDVDLAKSLAAKNGKLVLLHFTAEWCRPCKQLKTFVFASPNVVAAIDERFVPVMVDTDENPELVKQYDVDSIPMDIAITPTGRVLQKRQSPKDATNFVRMVKAVDNADTQYATRTAVISQKIGDVLQEIENGSNSKLKQSNDFAAKTPELETQGPSKDSKQLVARSKTRLVDHVADVNEGAASFPKPAASATALGPERVINDRFFAEKSHPNQQISQTASATINQNTQSQATGRIQPSQNDQLRDVKHFISGAAKSAQTVQNPMDEGREPMAIPSGGEFVPFVSKTADSKPSQAMLQKSTQSTDSRIPQHPSATSVVTNQANQTIRGKSSARLLRNVEEVPGKIEVNAVRQNLSKTRTTVNQFDENGTSLVRAKIVASNEPESKITNAVQKNLLRSTDFSMPDLVRGGHNEDLRDSVQKMFTSEQQPSVNNPPQPSSKVGLGGKCPVGLVQDGKWIMGDKKFGCVHRGRTYLFANAENLAAFQKSPEKYSPILAGFDPVMFHKQGELVEGQEKHGVFMGKAPDHRIVLFTTQESRDEFQQNPKKFMATVRLAIKQSDTLR